MIVGHTKEFPPVCLLHDGYCHCEGHVSIEAEDGSLGEIEFSITHDTPIDSFWANWIGIYNAVKYGFFSLICYYLRCEVDDPRRKCPSGMMHKLYGHSVTYVG